MLLKDFLDMINEYQDFQIIDSKTGHIYTPMMYLEDSMCYEEAMMWGEYIVTGVSTSITTDKTADEKTSYLKIMIKRDLTIGGN